MGGRLSEAVDLLCSNGSSPVRPQTYSHLLQECVNRKQLFLGRRIHGRMVTVGFPADDYLTTKLLILYAKNDDLDTARKLFDRVPKRDRVPWNAMISGFVQKGFDGRALLFYYEMRSSGLGPDQFTFASVFRACARLASLDHGRRAHCALIKSSVKANVIVDSALIDMYFKCSSMDDGLCVFDGLSDKNVITWTALISGYGQHGWVSEVFGLFRRMIDDGFRPNYVTFAAVLSTCSRRGLVEEGWHYFSLMTREYNIRPRGEHYATMVDLLGRLGYLKEAYELLLQSPYRTRSVIWGALVGACRMHKDLNMLRLASRRFFELECGNAGKYVVVSNAYADLQMWEEVADLRQTVRKLGIKREPGLSSVEVGDNSLVTF
ncbi:Pentatricopeptide repeat-containing protein [Acorus gramineus]|uniref:Pentatricopeptide repeat-containing protein n=1 Tax=Acorus gramineus TaxID=55184 RepID=A0AAV9AYK5_ACOGR|nr:Pentatricopeptide repeat-containing protein [Acorus gramineus]